MEDKKGALIKKSGRKPKTDPAVYRYSISLTAQENARFLSLFEESEMKVKAHFITACVFDKPVKTIKMNMDAVQYHTSLTKLYGQFRAIGVNYNQVVKLMHRNFSEKKTFVYLSRLEKLTSEMVLVCQHIVQLTQEFNQNMNVNKD